MNNSHALGDDVIYVICSCRICGSGAGRASALGAFNRVSWLFAGLYLSFRPFDELAGPRLCKDFEPGFCVFIGCYFVHVSLDDRSVFILTNWMTTFCTCRTEAGGAAIARDSRLCIGLRAYP